MHIMLFGGAFDPPHNGHIQITQAILDQGIAEHVWLIPCAQHPFGKKMSAAADRLAMLHEVGSLTINTYETDRTDTSYTIETIEHFAKNQPNDTFSWLIGSDQLPAFTRWHRWQDLVTKFRVYVYPRQNFPFEQMQAGMIALKKLPLITVSSTMIRTLVSEGKPISHLVPSTVDQYIQTHNLYVK